LGVPRSQRAHERAVLGRSAIVSVVDEKRALTLSEPRLGTGITTSACGDKLERNGDALVIHAALPIDDLVPAPYRAPILLVGDERFILVAREGTRKRPLYRLRVAPEAGLYEPEGKVIGYDGDRHLERRRDNVRHALYFLLWVPTVPLLPFLGLLPEKWKDKLVHVGLDPGRATRLSIGLEWLLVALLCIAYPFMGGFFTLPGFICGAAALFVAGDICFRVTSDYDNRAPGAFALAGALKDWLKDFIDFSRGKTDLLTEEERARLLEQSDRPHLDADVKLTDARPRDP
jgi:hypothetical protein